LPPEGLILGYKTVSMLFASQHPPRLGRRLRNMIWPDIGFRRSARYLMHRLARLSASPHGIALGFAIGVFAGFSPLIGLHVFVAAITAFSLRASIVAALAGTVIGNPVTLPFIWTASYEVGSAIVRDGSHTRAAAMAPDISSTLLVTHPGSFLALAWDKISPVFQEVLLGSAVLGLVAAVLSYWIARRAVVELQKRRRAAIAKNMPPSP
jgi:hypothetical protein